MVFTIRRELFAGGSLSAAAEIRASSDHAGCRAAQPGRTTQCFPLPPGPERDQLLKQVRQNEIAGDIDQRLTSTFLRPPKKSEIRGVV